ncbi:hypothetical protein GO988_22745 [Hymenobacter sp. HMF4947]|uniref:Uncharacterized protein n=1 Tax=Hymenobacter ginkgonis TaxID=2682976 RepID=A0A7K1TL69_9BACT|nr:hypothetical protein [Hymenobacter ginkgonis]MVN79159.1 hypothetical protein [Hymenobacter ginkgonis]
MLAAAGAFLAAWGRTLPGRWRGLVVPYLRALAVFMVGYAGATALFQPWALGRWWQIGASAAGGLAACWWLWRPWALLATNSRGESRRVPLLFCWIVLALAGWATRDYLRYRLGEMRNLRGAQELAQPGNAIFFRLRGPFYIDQPHLGRYAALHANRQKGGRVDYFATCDYACPLLVAAADTSVFRLTPPGWLSYSYRADLGTDLPPGERSWRYQNFVARTNARFDSLHLADFAYLLRVENASPGQYRAVRASHLAPYYGSPLLLAPVRASFALRGGRTLHRGLWALGAGSAFVIFLLLIMPLRPAAEAGY